MPILNNSATRSYSEGYCIDKLTYPTTAAFTVEVKQGRSWQVWHDFGNNVFMADSYLHRILVLGDVPDGAKARIAMALPGRPKKPVVTLG